MRPDLDRNRHQFVQQTACEVAYNTTLHRHRRRLHSQAGRLLETRLDALTQTVGERQPQKVVELHNSIARHFWEAIKARMGVDIGEEQVTEAELRGFVTSATWVTKHFLIFGHEGSKDGWQVDRNPTSVKPFSTTL